MRFAVLMCVLCAILLAGCGPAETPAASTPVAAFPSAAAVTEAAPTAAPTASPTHTPTITPSAAPTVTPTPTPTPTPTHALMIEVMRRQSYLGSDITIEQKLSPGATYDRYLVPYLSEGLKIYALLTVPRGEKPASGWPVIIFNHGYIPPTEYRTTERYAAYVDALARSGYIVLKPDYRGHGNSEGEAVGGYGSPAYTIDVLNALASIQRFPDADPERIGMWGHSMGGHITLRAMVVSKEIKAGVIWAGVVASYPDLFSRWRRPSASAGSNALPTPTPDPRRGRWRQELTATYGTPEENPAFWASISPNTYVAELSGPIQLHHGTGDESVPWEFSQMLCDQIIAAGGYAELYLYEGDNHNLSNSFSLAMRRTIQFFDTYLK
ncbi:MAG: alpha/beta hydrolase family protein [Anaerolineae bacterium]